jgi:hypothetical protein
MERAFKMSKMSRNEIEFRTLAFGKRDCAPPPVRRARAALEQISERLRSASATARRRSCGEPARRLSAKMSAKRGKTRQHLPSIGIVTAPGIHAVTDEAIMRAKVEQSLAQR